MVSRCPKTSPRRSPPFELEPRDIIAVLEHYRARAAAGETGVFPASPWDAQGCGGG